MRFHFPSFLLGCAAGATAILLGRELKPIAVEGATGIYQLWDALWARAAMFSEDIEDILTEARARAEASRRSDSSDGASGAATQAKPGQRAASAGSFGARRTARTKSRAPSSSQT